LHNYRDANVQINSELQDILA